MRSINWPKWKIASDRQDIEKREDLCRSGCRSKRPSSKDRNSRGRHAQTSFNDLKILAGKMLTKSANHIEEYLKEAKEGISVPGSPDGTVNSHVHRQNAASPKRVESQYYRSSIAQSFTRLKDNLRSKRIDHKSRMKRGKSYDSSKARTKKRRFVLPKSLVIGRRSEDETGAKQPGDSVDPIDEQLRSPTRYCYLEALRIKTNWS